MIDKIYWNSYQNLQVKFQKNCEKFKGNYEIISNKFEGMLLTFRKHFCNPYWTYRKILSKI